MNHAKSGSHHRLAVLVVVIGVALLAFALFRNFLSDQTDIEKTSANHSSTAKIDYQPPDQSGYVGSGACAECHAQIAKTYASHPMAVSIRPVSENVWSENEYASTSIPGKRRVLAVECQSDRLVHLERMFDGQEELIYEQPVSMKYVVGSGQRGKAYLHQVDELLFMSPLNWYRQSSSWDLAPNYQPDDLRRFRRRVAEDCLSCHAGRVSATQRNSNRFPSPVFHETMIGCERCHGPGEDHIAFHQASIAMKDKQDPIVNPARLDHIRQESVCYQCHLSAAARVLRPGRSHLDFRPGMKLSDIWAVLDVGTQITGDSRTKSVNHVQQMRDSRCFIGSGEKMGCISCHDPHQTPDRVSQMDFYREKCLKCHQNQDCTLPHPKRLLKEDNCIACHMRSLPSSNMSHVAQTDHRILKQPTQNQAEETIPTLKELTFFADTAADLSKAEQQRSLTLGTFLYRTRYGIPFPMNIQSELERTLVAFPDDYLALTSLGELARKKNELRIAASYLTRACQVSESHEGAMDTLMEVSYLMADWKIVLECSEELVAIDPTDPRIHAMRGDALMNLDRRQEGIESVEQAAQLNPGSLPLHEWLLKQYLELGQIQKVQQRRKLIERLRSAKIPEKLRPTETNN